MIRRDISKINTENKKQRDIVLDVQRFIEGTKCYEGNILVLYGLRRTGKTTIMEQALEYYSTSKSCAFFEVEDSDELADVKRIIIDERQKGTTVICFDEITKANDFITNSAALPDIFAKEGMRIIVTGTDSLGFQFAENSELYDRTIRLNTTHISFAEHCRVLNTSDMDDYIQFGGLMKKGAEPEDRVVYDYYSACKYLDSAVADNISRSIKRNQEDSCLEDLSMIELRTIIEKMVELYSGVFSKKNIQEELKKVSVNYSVEKLSGIVDTDIIERLTLENRNIVRDFAKVINADIKIKHIITDEMIYTLERYLIDMNLLSATSQINFYYTDEFGWREGELQHEYYIIQPALKYYHLQKGKEFIEKEEYYKELSGSDKQFMQDKLDEKIKGDMTEQIIIYDVFKDLSCSRYTVCKPVFYVNGQRKGEYDMLVYDKENNQYWGFEIKHTINPYYRQEQHLKNEMFAEIMEKKYGDNEKACVLYRGSPFKSASGVLYLNITDFMLAIDKYHDMHKAMSELTKGLLVQDISEGKNIEKEQHIRKLRR